MNDFSIFDDARTVENELSTMEPVVEQPESTASRLGSMYSHTSRLKPAERMQMARDMDRAARANIAPMLAGVDEAIERSRNLDFATMSREAPSVSKFLSSADGIYAGFDYAGELWKMEKGIRRYNIAPEGSDPWGESLSAYEATLGAVWQGVQDVRNGLSALNADQRNNIYATLNEMGGSGAIDALNMSDEGREILHDIFDSGWVYEESDPETDEYRKKWQERFANSGWGTQLAAEVFRALPTTAATLAGAAATAPLGVPALGGWLAGAATIYGMSLDQYLSDPDMKDENHARFAAVGNALFQGALEGIGAGRLVRTFTPKSTLGKAFKTWALGSAQEGATEALQVIPERIFGELAKGGRAEQEDLASLLGEFVAAIPSLFSADVLAEMRHAGLVGALTGGLASAPGNVPSVVEAVKNSRQAAKERAFLVTQTKMAQETPHTLKKVVEAVTAEGGAPETVYVKAAEVNGLFQMDDFSEQEMDAYLENAGIARQDFDAALAVDGDVSVPFANVHLLMSREDAAAMFESLNTTPDDAMRGTMEVAEQVVETDNPFGAMDADTLAEVLNVSEEDRAEMLKTASQLAEDADVTEAEQRAEYRQSVKDALIAATKGYANAYTERQADAYAQVLDHAVATFAKTYGLTVNQAYSRLAPTFLRETATQQDLQDAIDLAVANAAGAHAMGVNPALVSNMREVKGQRVKLEEVNPLYALVKGRLDAKSLAKDFPDAAKELKAVHKNRLFKSKAKGGLAIDELADEAVRAGLLPEGSDGSTLVEWLKDERNFRFDAMLQGVLFQAMYAAREQDIVSFANRVREEGQQAKKSYFAFAGSGGAEGWEVRVPSDTIFHQLNRHPDMTDEDNMRLPDVVAALDVVVPSKREKGQFGKAFLGSAQIEGQGYGIVVEANTKGQLFVTTFFKDSDERLAAWLQSEKKASKAPAASDTESALNPGVSLGRLLKSNIPQTSEDINTLFQNELAEAVIKDTEKGGSIELGDGSYIYWETTSDSIEVYDEDGMPDYEDGPEYMLISALYVSPESRGKGLGRRLLRSALNRISRTRPGIDIRLSADPIADEAVAQEDLVGFYSSEGFDAEYVDGMSGVPMTWDRRPRWTAVNTLYQRAWHGTPHKFDAFDLSFMGAGEGAQAHGWGLYFAQDKRVSEGYRERLAKKNNGKYEITIGGEKPIGRIAGELSSASAEALEKAANGDLSGLRDRAQRVYDGITHEYEISKGIYDEIDAHVERAKTTPKLSISGFLKTVPENLKYRFKAWADYAKKRAALENRRATGQDFLESMKIFTSSLKKELDDKKQLLEYIQSIDWDTVKVKAPSEGQLFEVEIPDNDVLLDEQLTYNEQPEKVKIAIEQAIYALDDVGAERPYPRKIIDQLFVDGAVTGKEIYNAFMVATGSDRSASLFLNRFGVKGITYSGALDGRCFVVFDDKAIQILDKLYSMMNGQPLGSYQGLASIDPVALGKGIITFFNGADISTAGHEMGHWFRQVLELGTKMETVTEAAFADWKAACDFVGAEYNQPWTVAQEEKFADAFVDYLKRGKAPSKNLRSAFLKLKRWLLDLYERVTNRGTVNCSAEMRRVFDHLLATEEELRAAKEKTSIKTSLSYQDVPADWLGGEIAKRLAQANADAEASAAEAIHAAMSSELRRNVSAWRKEGREMADRNYMQQVFDRIAEAGGLMVTEEVEARYGSDVLSAISAKRRGKAMLNRDGGGLDLEMLADEMGYTGPAAVDNMMNDMAEAPSKKMLVEQYVQDRLAMWADTFKAEEVMLTDEVQTLLAEESAALAGVLGQESVATDELTKQAMKQVMLLEVGHAADGLAALKAAAKAKADKARAALRVVAEYEKGKADKALEKADNRAKSDKDKVLAAKHEARRKLLEQAFDAKEKQRRAVAEIRARHAAKELGRKFDRRVKRVLKAKPEQIDFAWHEQIRGLAAMFGIGKGKLDPKGADAQTLQQFVTALQDEWNTVIPVPQWILETSARGKSWRKLTVGQLSELYDTFVWLEHRGRLSKTLKRGLDRIALDHGVEEMTASMDSLKSKEAIADYERGRISRKGLIATARKIMADITLPEYEFDAADGYRKGTDRAKGAHAQLIVNPLYEAQSRELELQQKMAQEIDAAMAPFRKRRDTKERWAVGGVKLPDDVQKEWGPQWCNYERTIMVALNMGNEGNLKALMRGYGWTRKDLDKITATLTDEDWTMVQKIWDIIDSLYPELNKSYRALNGIPMSKVEALPLKLAHGRVLKGGYFPLIFDGKFSMTAAKQQEEDAMRNAQAAVVRNVKPKDGFTNTRKGGAKPPKLSASVIGQHLTDSIHYIAFAEPLQQVQRIFNDKRWRAKFSDKFGEPALMELQPWLNNIARPKRPIMTAHESVIEWARHMGTVQALGFKVSSAAMQVTSLSASASEIGWGPLLNGMNYVATHRGEALKLMRELSPMMAQRSNSITRDIAANLNRLNPDRRTLRWESNGQTHELAMQDVERAAFAMMSVTDSMVAAPTFFGAYFKALKENGGNEREAVTYAERSVAKAQSSGHSMNLSTLQQDNGIGKLLTMFMTYTMNLQNRMRYQTRGVLEGKISKGAYMAWLANDIILPACLAVLVKGLLESGDVPDEPKKYAKEVGYSVLSGFPLLRGIQSAVEYGMGYSPFSSSINKGFEGPVEMLKSAYKAGMYFYEDDDEKAKAQVFRFVKKSLETAGFVTGTPTKPVIQFFEGAWQITHGETNNPAALFVKQR